MGVVLRYGLVDGVVGIVIAVFGWKMQFDYDYSVRKCSLITIIRSENAVWLRLFSQKMQFDYDYSVGKCSYITTIQSKNAVILQLFGSKTQLDYVYSVEKVWLSWIYQVFICYLRVLKFGFQCRNIHIKSQR